MTFDGLEGGRMGPRELVKQNLGWFRHVPCVACCEQVSERPFKKGELYDSLLNERSSSRSNSIDVYERTRSNVSFAFE